jgi:hypothetical protein
MCVVPTLAEGDQDAVSQIPNYEARETRRDMTPSPLSAQGFVRPGDLFIFANPDLSGPSKTFNALDICYKIPAGFPGDVRSVIQFSGAMCWYFLDDDMYCRSVLMSAPSTTSGWKLTNIDPAYKITGISCIKSEAEVVTAQ